ncbi:eCIS core domain-containing protein [Chitinimonas naiadis]
MYERSKKSNAPPSSSLQRQNRSASPLADLASVSQLSSLASQHPHSARLQGIQLLANDRMAAGRLGALQRKADAAAKNNSGLPAQLKTGIESLSGMNMDHVNVHYNSAKPAQLNAHAYAQGSDIHLAPGQEQHLPHEAWHVVQQAQGRVKPTVQMKGGVPINDDAGLEHEADVMGAKALASQPAAGGGVPQLQSRTGTADTLQLYRIEAATGIQGGNYVRGSASIHLHIDIGKKSHLKIEGDSINIATSGGLLSKVKMTEAIVKLLEFKESIKTDLSKAGRSAVPIQDCIDWLVEQGATMPEPTAASSEEEVAVIEEATVLSTPGNADDPYGMGSAAKTSNSENKGKTDEDFWL